MARRSSTIGHDPLKAEARRLAKEAAADPAATEAPERPDGSPSKEPGTVNERAASSEPTEREARALALVQTYLGWSAGAALLPVPIIDFAAIIGVQVKMLQSMATIYDVPFRTNMVRPLIVTLVSGGGAVVLGAATGSLVKGIPLIGMLAGILAQPAFATASCYATGKVFIRHFESGGTFLDFNPAKARAYYAEQFVSAKGKA